ncbi:hypothetical protein [Ornithinibacillus californiensis]|uniref:hypothetical protein n=1 Tax=Ornithinibacillus californiensis TaxID=161536 RepID=UPI00069CF972|nr:hypothetical protein [Ornithinibacillus californiensis]
MNQNNYMNHQNLGDLQSMQGDMKSLCQRYMNYHVMAQMNDGSQFDGIIEGMDDNGVTMLIPEEVDSEQMELNGENRQFGFDFNGYGGYDNYGYGRPRRRFRRYRRQRFPLNLFSRLFLFPYYSPLYSPFYPGY